MRYRFGILLLLAAGAAYADQYSDVTVHRALQAIADDPAVHVYCAPCGDARSRPVRVRQVEIGRVREGASAQAYRAGDGQICRQVCVNREPVGLAHLYARGGGWESLALKTGLPALEMPRQLAPAQAGP